MQGLLSEDALRRALTWSGEMDRWDKVRLRAPEQRRLVDAIDAVTDLLNATPPQKTKTTIPALKVADFAVLSAMPDHLAVSALAEALSDIVAAQRHANPVLALLGVIVCAVPRPKTRLARELVAYVERTCVDAAGQTLKFSTEISRSVVVQEAQKMGQTIMQYQGDHPVADEYRKLAKEFEDRLTVLRQLPPIPLTEEVTHA